MPLKWIFTFSLLLLAPLQAQDGGEDQLPFKRITKQILLKRTAAELGNQYSKRHPDMRISSPQYSGNGCMPGEVAVVLTEDKRALSILFNSYVVNAGDSVGLKRQLKACTLLIPLHIPPRHRVTVVGLDYRGFVAIPQGAHAALVAKHQFFTTDHRPASRRLRMSDRFNGPFEQDYILTAELKTRKHWSRCGGDAVLRIQTELGTQSNGQGEDTIATLDSVDGDGSDDDLTYHLLWEECGGP